MNFLYVRNGEENKSYGIEIEDISMMFSERIFLNKREREIRILVRERGSDGNRFLNI